MSLTSQILAVSNPVTLKALITELDTRDKLTNVELNALRSVLNRAKGYDKDLHLKLSALFAMFSADSVEGYDESDFTDSKSSGQSASSANINNNNNPTQPNLANVVGSRKEKIPTDAEIEVVNKKLPFDFNLVKRVMYNEKDLEDFCTLVEVKFEEEEDMIAMMEAVMYIGFKWREVFSKLRFRAKMNKITKSTFTYHMRLICAVYVERGSAFFRRGVENLTNTTVKTYINALVKLYDIVLIRPPTGYLADDVTITRIVAIFPDLVARIIKKFSKTPIASETSPSVPKHLKFPGGASLIPSGQDETYKSWLIWYRAFGKVVNKGVEPTEESVKRYGDAIRNSDVTSDETRRVIFNL